MRLNESQNICSSNPQETEKAWRKSLQNLPERLVERLAFGVRTEASVGNKVTERALLGWQGQSRCCSGEDESVVNRRVVRCWHH